MGPGGPQTQRFGSLVHGDCRSTNRAFRIQVHYQWAALDRRSEQRYESSKRLRRLKFSNCARMKVFIKIRTLLRRWLLRSLQPCQMMVPLMSESMDRSLGAWEWLQLRLHLIVCAWCARYLKQIKSLRQLLRDRPY